MTTGMLLTLTLKEQFSRSVAYGAKVVPIYIKGPTGKPVNYRHVSLNCIVCRIFKALVKENMTLHLERHNLISKHGSIK